MSDFDSIDAFKGAMKREIRKAKGAPESSGVLYIGAPNPEGWGPWVGVPEERQDVCAVDWCLDPGKPQVCLADGANHHHGCVHYKHLPDHAGLTFREGGWCWLCDHHYQLLKEANPNARGAR
jgi:hypothetical protein